MVLFILQFFCFQVRSLNITIFKVPLQPDKSYSFTSVCICAFPKCDSLTHNKMYTTLTSAVVQAQLNHRIASP